jgi:hypothetical protein
VEEIMSSLLSQHPASAGMIDLSAEQRAEPRYHCPRLARVSPHKGPKNLSRLSIVRNISANGIGLLLTSPLEPGTQIVVELRSRSIVTRVAQVVHASKQEGGWLVGCTLDNPLSDPELSQLRP